MWKTAWKLCVGALALMAGSARGHGYLATPESRNVQMNSDYCPQCLNAGGTWAVFQGGLPGKYGVCGDPADGPRKHERPVRISKTYRAGEVIRVKVVLTANHKGRWGLKLCPSTNVSQECFDAHVLKRTDGRDYTNVGSKSTFSVKYRLPKGVRCRWCVLQWTYETANSCNLPGSPVLGGLPDCRSSTNWERFWNCADVRIT